MRVTWEDGSASQFHSAWLQHNAPEHTQGDNGQKLLGAFQHLEDTISDVKLTDDRSRVKVWWSDSAQVLTFPMEWLRLHDYSRDARRAVRDVSLPRAARPRLSAAPSQREMVTDTYLRWPHLDKAPAVEYDEGESLTSWRDPRCLPAAHAACPRPARPPFLLLLPSPQSCRPTRACCAG